MNIEQAMNELANAYNALNQIEIKGYNNMNHLLYAMQSIKQVIENGIEIEQEEADE